MWRWGKRKWPQTEKKTRCAWKCFSTCMIHMFHSSQDAQLISDVKIFHVSTQTIIVDWKDWSNYFMFPTFADADTWNNKSLRNQLSSHSAESAKEISHFTLRESLYLLQHRFSSYHSEYIIWN